MVLTGCSTIPYSIDSSTYSFYKGQVDRQRAGNDKESLVGIYRVAFVSEDLVENVEEATAVTGDWKVAALFRGADLDFISLSGLTGFGPLSDQGGSFSVNVQGSTLWSFPRAKVRGDSTLAVGKAVGLFDDSGGVATLSKLNRLTLRISVDRSGNQNAVNPLVYFLIKLEE